MNRKKRQILVKWIGVLILILTMVAMPSLKVEASTINGVFGDVEWTIEEGVLTFGGGTFDNWEKKYDSPWSDHEFEIDKIVFTEKVVAAENSQYLFANMSDLVEIEGLDKLDTSNVINMYKMFEGNTSLKYMDVSNFDVSNAEDLSYVFSYCPKLVALDLSNWNIPSTANYEGIFHFCLSLRSLALGENSLMSRHNYETELPWVDPSESEEIDEADEDKYTGRWIGITTGKVYEDSEVFMEEYDGSFPDTYVWQKYVTIDFDNNGSSFADSQTLLQGEKLVKPADPTREDYRFGGWYDETFTEQWDFENMPMTDMTLYAKWISTQTYSVIYEGNGHTSGDVPVDNTLYEIDDRALLLPCDTMERDNYIFSGWNTEADGRGLEYLAGFEMPVTETITLYAQWLPASSTIDDRRIDVFIIEEKNNDVVEDRSNVQTSIESAAQVVQTQDNSSIELLSTLFLGSMIVLASKKF